MVTAIANVWPAPARLMQSTQGSKQFDPRDKCPGACTEFHKVHTELH